MRRGGMGRPKANSVTKTPKALAVTKWPSSWTKTRKARTGTIQSQEGRSIKGYTPSASGPGVLRNPRGAFCGSHLRGHGP